MPHPPHSSLLVAAAVGSAHLHPTHLHPIHLHPTHLHPIHLHPIYLHPIYLHPTHLHPTHLHPITWTLTHLANPCPQAERPRSHFGISCSVLVNTPSPAAPAASREVWFQSEEECLLRDLLCTNSWVSLPGTAQNCRGGLGGTWAEGSKSAPGCAGVTGDGVRMEPGGLTPWGLDTDKQCNLSWRSCCPPSAPGTAAAGAGAPALHGSLGIREAGGRKPAISTEHLHRL